MESVGGEGRGGCSIEMKIVCKCHGIFINVKVLGLKFYLMEFSLFSFSARRDLNFNWDVLKWDSLI